MEQLLSKVSERDNSHCNARLFFSRNKLMRMTSTLDLDLSQLLVHKHEILGFVSVLHLLNNREETWRASIHGAAEVTYLSTLLREF